MGSGRKPIFKRVGNDVYKLIMKKATLKIVAVMALMVSTVSFSQSQGLAAIDGGSDCRAWICQSGDKTCNSETVSFEDGESITVIISGIRYRFKNPCPQ